MHFSIVNIQRYMKTGDKTPPAEAGRSAMRSCFATSCLLGVNQSQPMIFQVTLILSHSCEKYILWCWWHAWYTNYIQHNNIIHVQVDVRTLILVHVQYRYQRFNYDELHSWTFGFKLVKEYEWIALLGRIQGRRIYTRHHAEWSPQQLHTPTRYQRHAAIDRA